MALLSYILLAISTVGACLAGAKVPMLTGPFLVSVAVMVASVIMMRLAFRAKIARNISADNGESFDFIVATKTVLESLRALEANERVGCSEIHAELDKIVDGPLFEFAEARHNLLAIHGFGGFARIVGEFSRGERAVNRAWSAAVDGYLQESRVYVTRAREIFTDLAGEFDKL